MECKDNFMLHYNFPPFSVGECGRIGTGRREIGGKLAWRAIESSLPKENFPYTLKWFLKLQSQTDHLQWQQFVELPYL